MTGPFDHLRRFINRNIIPQRGKRDKLSVTLRNGQGTFVYIVERDGQTQYWLPNVLFEEVVGGESEAEAQKKDLYIGGLLVTDRRGKGVGYVVKRIPPDGSKRRRFVVLRHSPKKKLAALGHTLAAPATV